MSRENKGFQDTPKMHHALLEIVGNIERSGADPMADFFYLGGPMTNIPHFNFPRFQEVADRLRAQGYNIVSPAELGDPVTLAIAAASATGDHSNDKGDKVGDKSYNDFLSRDLIICSLTTCVGGIFLDGWQHSRGARGETWVLQFLQKELYEYSNVGGQVSLTNILDRDVRLGELGVELEGVPQDAPGLRTKAHNGGKQ
jgi:hypothetical protein